MSEPNSKGEVVYAFIDSQNLHYGIKRLGWKLDYKKFRKYLYSEFNVHKAFMYFGYVHEYRKIYSLLRKAGFNLIFKETKKIKNASNLIKGNVDVALAVDCIKKLEQFNKAVFVSADGDFLPLYDYIVERNKEIKIMVPNSRAYSSLLRRYRKYIIKLDDKKKKLGK